MHTVFKSVRHPEDRSAGLVYTEALGPPLAACVTPIMIGAAAAALQGQSVYEFLVWGFPAALFAATFWTHFQLSRVVAELHLRPGQAAVRSIRDVLQERPPTWHTVHNVRITHWHTEISFGWNTLECHPDRWPEYDHLKRATRRAFDQQQHSCSYA